MRILLEDITVYTWTGKKHLYKLGDMAYGQWLIFKDGLPVYYLNIFDALYEHIDAGIKKDPYIYLEEKFKQYNNGYSLNQNIRGIWPSSVNDKWFELEMLPLRFFE